ncbi:MAG: hypothetical protein JST92_05695 [Deltaproteobacteria bacterium]|nr:hypothetical protein [Deltaproteobacteria bacterium]
MSDAPDSGPATPPPGSALSRFLAGPPVVTQRTRWLARGLALTADALQLGLFPLFGEGAASPLNLGLDVAMALVCTRLLGFHWSFAPTVVAELIPVVDLAPTWTAAVLLATVGSRKPQLPK